MVTECVTSTVKYQAEVPASLGVKSTAWKEKEASVWDFSETSAQQVASAAWEGRKGVYPCMQCHMVHLLTLHFLSRVCDAIRLQLSSHACQGLSTAKSGGMDQVLLLHPTAGVSLATTTTAVPTATISPAASGHQVPHRTCTVRQIGAMLDDRQETKDQNCKCCDTWHQLDQRW